YYNHNGLLYSKDIKELNLSNTKLAVISTCNSGSGLLLNTGGIIGIQKALFLAGAESLLVTLWEIEDKVTQEFMIAFYTQWTKNEDNKEAFNFAKSVIKEKYLYPFYWAGYRILNNSLLKILEYKND
ncbi:MAG: CHAT domain-containing protein, partial [Melioribacteraceae bacterium]